MAEQASLSRSAQGGSANLADVLERVLDKGIVIAGDIKLLLADIEVLTLQIRLVICSVDKAKEVGLDWWTNNPAFSPYRKPQPRQPVESKQQAQPQPQVEPKPQPQAEAKPEPQPQVEVKPRVEPKPQTEPKPEPQPEVEPKRAEPATPLERVEERLARIERALAAATRGSGRGS